MAPWAAERFHGLLRHESKIQKCVRILARNRYAALEVNPGLLRQEFLEGGIAHSGDVGSQKNRRRTPDCFPFPRFDQERDSVDTVVSGGKDSGVGFNGALKQFLVVLV